MQRRKLLTSDWEGGLSREEIVAGDILLAKSNGDKVVIKSDEKIPNGWTAIGIVTVPPYHNMYGTEEGAAVSLVHLDNSSPDFGEEVFVPSVIGQSPKTLYIGPTSGFERKWTSKVFMYDCIYVTESWQADETLQITVNSVNWTGSSNTSWTILPIGDPNLSATRCKHDCYCLYNTGLYDSNDCKHAPSPYISENLTVEGFTQRIYGTLKSPIYSLSESGFTRNCLSDFNGKENTALILECADDLNLYPSWRTDATISNNGDDYTAAKCAWRFHTVGTSQGDWYIPAMGELGYLGARMYDIQRSLKIVLNLNDNDISTNALIQDPWGSSGTNYISSTIVANNRCCGLLSSQLVAQINNYVRPFIRF